MKQLKLSRTDIRTLQNAGIGMATGKRGGFYRATVTPPPTYQLIKADRLHLFVPNYYKPSELVRLAREIRRLRYGQNAQRRWMSNRTHPIVFFTAR